MNERTTGRRRPAAIDQCRAAQKAVAQSAEHPEHIEAALVPDQCGGKRRS
jgi:hypothetical protein